MIVKGLDNERHKRISIVMECINIMLESVDSGEKVAW